MHDHSYSVPAKATRRLSGLVAGSLLLCGVGAGQTAHAQNLAKSAVLKPAVTKTVNAPVSKAPAASPASRRVDVQSVKALSRYIEEMKEKAEEEREEAERKPGARKEEPLKRVPRANGDGFTLQGAHEEESPTEYYDAYLHRLRMRAFPNDRIDSAAYLRGLQQQRQMPTSHLAGAVASAPAAPDTVTAFAANSDITQTSGRWYFIGPTKMKDPTGVQGTYASGRINRVAYDPSPAGRNVVYCTGAQGGVWKSTNNGQNWTPVGDKWNTLYATAVAVGSNRAVYVGLGDYDGGGGYQYATGVMKSTDQGATWTNVGAATLTGLCISSIVVDPVNPNFLVASAGRGTQAGGLFRSTDGGQNWTRVTPAGFNGNWSKVDIGTGGATGVTGGRYYWASLEGNGIFRSDDQGQTWIKVPFTFPFNNPNGPGEPGIQVGASRILPNTVYVIDASSGFSNNGASDGRLWRSDDAGATWLDISGSFPASVADGNFGNFRNNFSQASYDLHLVPTRALINGTFRELIYGAGLSLAATLDGGPNWTDITFSETGNSLIHTDQHDLAANPFTTNANIAANDGGVYGVVYQANAGNWGFDRTLSGTLGVTQFYHADWSATNPNLIIGGAQDNSTPRATGVVGALNQWDNIGGGDGSGVAIDPFDNNGQFTSAQNGVIYATDDNWANTYFIGGGTDFWRDTTNVVTTASNAPFIGVLHASTAADVPGLMYYGTQYLFRYDRLGVLGIPYWEVDTNFKIRPMGGTKLTTTDNDYVTAIATAPNGITTAGGGYYNVLVGQRYVYATPGNVVYAGTSDGQLWLTINATDDDSDADHTIKWFKLNSASLPNRAITSISVNPNNGGDILVGLSGTGSGHIYRLANVVSANKTFTDQGGFSTRRLPDVPLNDISRDPIDPVNTLFAATDIGVFTSIDGGSNWSNATLPLGLPTVECTQIKANDRLPRGNGKLNVATFGRGMWRFDLPDAPAPNLNLNVTIQRQEPRYVFNLTVNNSGGPATNVTVGTITITTDRGQTVTGGGFTIGDMPSGAVRILPLSLPTTFARAGTGVTLTTTLTFNGTSKSFTSRTRLP